MTVTFRRRETRLELNIFLADLGMVRQSGSRRGRLLQLAVAALAAAAGATHAPHRPLIAAARGLSEVNCFEPPWCVIRGPSAPPPPPSSPPMETRRSLKGMGLGIDNEVMSEFHSADTNEDGELQYDEFKRLVGHLTDDESLQA